MNYSITIQKTPVNVLSALVLAHLTAGLPTLTLSCYETPAPQMFSVNTKLNDAVLSSCSVQAYDAII